MRGWAKVSLIIVYTAVTTLTSRAQFRVGLLFLGYAFSRAAQSLVRVGLEPDSAIVILCCVRSQREKCGVSEKRNGHSRVSQHGLEAKLRVGDQG